MNACIYCGRPSGQRDEHDVCREVAITADAAREADREHRQAVFARDGAIIAAAASGLGTRALARAAAIDPGQVSRIIHRPRLQSDSSAA